jgi:hypothetical protein
MKKLLFFILAILLAAPAMAAKVCRSDTDSDVPAGSVITMPVKYLHSGYLLCDGSAVSRTTYSKLFAVIGTTYGAGNSSSTFNLPNFQGMFLRGAGGNADTVGTKQLESVPNITGTTKSMDDNSGSYSGAFYHMGFIDDASGTMRGSYAGFDASLSNAAYGRRNEVAPANYSVYYYIRY